MSNFQSVTISEGETFTSDSGPAQPRKVNGLSMMESAQSQPDRMSQGRMNDMASSQPGKMKVSFGGDGSSTVEHIGTTSTSSGGPSGLPGVLSTIEDRHGTPVGDMSTLDPKTATIQVGSTRCTLETAMSMGLLHRDGAGNIIPSEQLQTSFAKGQEKAPSQTVDLVSDHRGTLNQLYERAGVNSTTAFVGEMIQAAIYGGDVSKAASQFAEQAGATDDSVYEWGQSYVNDLFNIGMDAASELGNIDRDELTQFASELPKSTQVRLLLAVHMGDRSALTHLVHNYRNGIKS